MFCLSRGCLLILYLQIRQEIVEGALMEQSADCKLSCHDTGDVVFTVASALTELHEVHLHYLNITDTDVNMKDIQYEDIKRCGHM